VAPTPTYAALTDSERQWIAAHVEYGRTLGLDAANALAISEFFDLSLLAVKSGEQSQEDANAVINVVAVLLGEHICATSTLRWAIVTDEFGTDLCLCSPETSWVFFPQSSVAKRWEETETEWVVPFLAWVQENVSEER
jgi:hypothetical protein